MPSSAKRSSGRVAGCGFIASCHPELSLDKVGKHACMCGHVMSCDAADGFATREGVRCVTHRIV